MSSKSTSLAALLALGLSFAQANAATTTLYDNGPDGQSSVDAARSIGWGYQVSNSFVLAATSTLTSISFSNWLLQGDTPLSVNWAITNSAPAVGISTTPVPLGTASTLSFTTSVPNSWGADVYNASFSLNKTLGPGTYYLVLGNEITSKNQYGYIGDSAGPLSATTAFQYNPSDTLNPAAYDAATDTYLPTTTSIPSSSFQITGVTPVPEPANFGLLAAGLGVLVLRFRRI